MKHITLLATTVLSICAVSSFANATSYTATAGESGSLMFSVGDKASMQFSARGLALSTNPRGCTFELPSSVHMEWKDGIVTSDGFNIHSAFVYNDYNNPIMIRGHAVDVGAMKIRTEYDGMGDTPPGGVKITHRPNSIDLEIAVSDDPQNGFEAGGWEYLPFMRDKLAWLELDRKYTGVFELALPVVEINMAPRFTAVHSDLHKYEYQLWIQCYTD